MGSRRPDQHTDRHVCNGIGLITLLISVIFFRYRINSPYQHLSEIRRNAVARYFPLANIHAFYTQSLLFAFRYNRFYLMHCCSGDDPEQGSPVIFIENFNLLFPAMLVLGFTWVPLPE